MSRCARIVGVADRERGLAARVVRVGPGVPGPPRVAVPTCLVLDVTLPGLIGLDLQQRLADRTDMPIIFITEYGDVPMTVRAMKAGAVEFLTKPFRDDVLVDAISGAIERSRAALRRDSEMRTLRSDFASMTPREREVMMLVSPGR